MQQYYENKSDYALSFIFFRAKCVDKNASMLNPALQIRDSFLFKGNIL